MIFCVFSGFARLKEANLIESLHQFFPDIFECNVLHLIMQGRLTCTVTTLSPLAFSNFQKIHL